MMQRQGQIEADGSTRRDVPQPVRAGGRSRTTPVEFLKGVRSELRKVAWPDRPEVVNYSTVVFVTLVILLFYIFGLNYVFGHAVSLLFGT